MTLRIKPNYQRVWAELGDNTKPVDSYIQNGWLAVKPPRQYMNWIQNRQDSMLAYLNQTGVGEWDVNTDYHGGAGTATCSYVQGSDGKIYKCLADNGPSVTGATSKDPVNQPANAAFWVVAFADKSVVDSLSATVATHTTQMGNGSGVTNAGAWRTALSVYSKTETDTLLNNPLKQIKYAESTGGVSLSISPVASGTVFKVTVCVHLTIDGTPTQPLSFNLLRNGGAIANGIGGGSVGGGGGQRATITVVKCITPVAGVNTFSISVIEGSLTGSTNTLTVEEVVLS